MEKKYINENRYKKNTTRKRRTLNTVKSNVNKKNKANKVDRTVVKVKKTSNGPLKAKKKTTKSNKSKKNNIIFCIIAIILIGIISRIILKEEKAPFIPEIFVTESNEQEIVVGIVTKEDLTNITTSNLMLTELNKYSKDMLLNINEDYTIKYKVLSDVQKVSNKEYILVKDKDSNVDIQDIKSSLENYIKNKDTKYYTKLNNVKEMTIINEDKLNIKLKQDDPYFIYNLDINLTSILDETTYLRDESTTKNQLVLTRSKKAEKTIPKKIVVKKYKDMYALIEAYKENIIDIAITNAQNAENILGKYEYNIKTVKSGETLFLCGNPESEQFKDNNIRQVITYGINRDNIIQAVLKGQGEKIDLPYIYDNVKYKYDVYAAENILLTNGYTKINNVYYKKENRKNTKLELDLIVNKNDVEKLQVANVIKNNLSAIGVSINVEKLSESKLNKRIKAKDYDLILATVNLNNNPNIEFLNANILKTDNITTASDKIINGTVQELSNNIQQLQNTLSEEIGIIGIYAKDIYVIYNKDVKALEGITYLNIFKNLFN